MGRYLLELNLPRKARVGYTSVLNPALQAIIILLIEQEKTTQIGWMEVIKEVPMET